MLKFFKNIKNINKRNRIYPSNSNVKSECNYHKQSLGEIELELKTNYTSGLTNQIAKKILEKNGKNKIKNFNYQLYASILKNLFYGFPLLIWFAALLSFISFKIEKTKDYSHLTLGIVILIILFFQTLFLTILELFSQQAIKSLQNISNNKTTVLRNGKKQEISATNLVIGDVVFLKSNTKVPADIRIFDVKCLKLDMSMITGENKGIEAITKAYRKDTDIKYLRAKNMAFMGSFVTNGAGSGIVVSVGNDTLINKISNISNDKLYFNKTWLQKEINRFSLIILIFAAICVIFYLVNFGVWLRSFVNTEAIVQDIISIILSVVPFSLPISITISVWLSAFKMKKCSIIVRNITSIQTLSSVNVIATDKTGTLTQNRMYVACLTTGTRFVETEACFYDSVVYIGVDKAIIQLLAICQLCNDAKLIRDLKHGNPTDLALLNFSEKNFKLGKVENYYHIISEIELTSTNKFHVKLFKPKDKYMNNLIFENDSFKEDLTDLNILVAKGAPDILIKKCKYIIEPNGKHIVLNATALDKINKIFYDWSSSGRRVILLCKRIYKNKEIEMYKVNDNFEKFFKKSCNDMCMIGLIGLIDPPREGISDTISQCRKAGIRVIMVTGDYKVTAASIASEIGILKNIKFDTLEDLKKYSRQNANTFIEDEENKKTKELTNFEFSGSIVLSGNDLEMLTKQEWKIICKKYLEIVIARSTPEHKLKVVQEFQENGFIVAMTGDGINDVLALKVSDVGIAMGCGSEVAMEAAHLILLDNSFSSITTSIENGRLAYDNIRKIIGFLMPACIFTETLATLSNILLGTPMLLSTFQMILICIFTDLFPSISLVFEKEEEDLLSRQPRNYNHHIVDISLLLNTFLFLGLLETIFAYTSFFVYLKWYGNININQLFFLYEADNTVLNRHENGNQLLTSAQTCAFVSIAIMQCIGALFSTRTRILSLFKSFPLLKKHRNINLFYSIFVVIIVMLLVIYLPIFNESFNTIPIPYQFYLIPIGYSFLIILLDEIRKLILRKNKLPAIINKYVNASI